MSDERKPQTAAQHNLAHGVGSVEIRESDPTTVALVNVSHRIDAMTALVRELAERDLPDVDGGCVFCGGDAFAAPHGVHDKACLRRRARVFLGLEEA